MTDCTRSEEWIVDALDGELAPGDRVLLERHLAACAGCAERARSYEEIRAAYRDVPASEPSAELSARIVERSREALASAPRPSVVRLVLVAAALLLAFVLVRRLSAPGRAPQRTAEELLVEGDALREEGRPLEALGVYEEALRLADGGDLELALLEGLARVHLDRGELERALERLDRLLERHPDDPRRLVALLLRGDTLERLGEDARARAVYDLVATEFPGARGEAARRMAVIDSRTPGPLGADDLEALQALGYGGD